MHNIFLKKILKKRVKNIPGFSLVELAIGIVIIGIILSFTLKGYEVYEEAKLHSVISQVEQFRLAHFNFVERYGALPGDFSQASQFIDKSLPNGNGNGYIDWGYLNQPSDSNYYWKHLTQTNLLIQPLTPQGTPSSKLGGIFTVEHALVADRPGIWYLLGEINANNNTGGLLTPQQAYFLDKKYDTGNPDTGHIRPRTGVGAENPCITSDNQYNLTTKSRCCIVYFQLSVV
jgi:prepilin-type N-terminal cleavage/methylation domain-containing protein